MKWLEIAKELPLGLKTRIDCECGSGKTLVLNHNNKYYSAHCYRCDYSPYHDKGKQTLADLARIKALNEAALADNLPLELPADFTLEIPLHGRLWLYSGGLTPSDWGELGFGYSAELDRVVMPIYKDNKLIWYQCRALLEGQKPKYIQPSKDRHEIMFIKHTESKERIVVVEDILSTVRVSKHIASASLLGTKITTAQANELAQYKRVTLWLDNDRAGRKGAYKIKKALSLLTNVDSVVTEEDPKKLDDETIKELLCISEELKD